MGCCNKTTDKKQKKGLSSMEDFKISHELPKEPIFSGTFGKLLYFIILLFIALTPIINFAAMYMFYIAVYGKNTRKKALDAKKHKDSDEA